MDAQLIAHPHLQRGKQGAQERIRQLIARHKAERRKAEYLQRVAAQMIPLLPKPVVAHILERAKESSQAIHGEKTHVRSR